MELDTKAKAEVVIRQYVTEQVREPGILYVPKTDFSD